MALTWDQISGITEKKFIKKMTDNIFDSNILLKRLKEKSFEELDGGLTIMQPLNYATTTATGWYTGADSFSLADNEAITSAEYIWRQMYASIVITGRDEKINSGDSAKISLVKSKTQIAEKTMTDALGTGIYNAGTTLNSLVGLQAIVAIASTIGGISQSSYSWWQAQVDSTTAVFSLAALQTLFNSCSVDNDTPTIAVATRANYNRYWSALQPQQRFSDSEVAKGGFTSLMFNGVPFVADSKCPTNNIFLLNEKYLHLWAHKDENMKFTGFQKPVNQNVRSGQVLFMGAFGSSNNRLHGKQSAVAA